jgi:hypothetical protein
LESAAKLSEILPSDRERLIRDAKAFLAQWGAEAARLGWTTEDVFGLHAAAPNARFDCMGLVPLLNGREVTSIAADKATIATASGATITYCRHRPYDGAVAAWELLH